LVCSHKSIFNRLAWRTEYSPYATPTVFIWSGPSWLLLVSYSQRKNSNGFSWLTTSSCLSACKRFWGVWINKNWMPYFRLEGAEFKK
jgi:hypothetical protein